jgi:hypothetical protein
MENAAPWSFLEAPHWSSSMIRFRCPLCNKTLKASEGQAGETTICPQCGEPSVIPAASESGEGSRSAVDAQRDQKRSRVGGRNRGFWVLVAVVVGMGLVSAVLVAVAPGGAMVLIPCFIVVLLILLHAYGTSCPSCGQWWARCQLDTEFVERAVFHKNDTRYARATYQTNYECRSCKHRWSVARTEEYRDFIRQRRQPRQRLG